MIDSGRWKEPHPRSLPISSGNGEGRLASIWKQLAYCEYEILPGPGKMMRWGVRDGQRDVETGELVHDDLIMSSALCGVLEGQAWGLSGPALVVQPARDPLRDLDKGF